MRITAIRQMIAPLNSAISNAYIDFSKMTASVVAVVTDVKRGSKLAKDMLLLDLRELADFTDYFFICSGTNPRQVQAICDEIDLRMKQLGLRATHTEGYNHAEWVLLDYVDFVAHIFTEAAREYYDLERLWADVPQIAWAEAPSA